MEALLKPACSTFPLRKYSTHERGYLRTDSPCITSRKMPVSYLNDVHRKWNIKQKFQLSALENHNQGYVEKLSHDKYMLENELSSSKHEDGYSILLKKLNAFYHFCRPYNLVGIVIGIFSVSVLPIQSIADLSPTYFMGLVQVNKQYLPLASGEFSSRDIVVIALLVTILSIGVVFMSKSPALLCALVVGYLYGTAYSAEIPFLRWKRRPLLAITSTVLTFVLGIQIPYFIHIQKYVLGRPNLITKSLIFQTTVMCLHCISGMIFKDIPDTDGDRDNGIETLSIRFGRERAFAIGLNILFAQFGLAMVLGASSSLWFGKPITVFGHLTLALVVWNRSRHTDPTDNSSAQSFHMFFWKLASIEFLLTQFVR
ncbi:coumarin 8-geranyltransferase 1b, chloroplastic-like isoform X2 [Macadamia integrifolia]|uniref:coumarin 8-geranyltransferase 1b, chloroplastic-like isoform X2 n=1 Tax=Macadamia integrifolia TaxID=60698 RepID=UPI001C4E6A36|nr:coumarin 8-geranyltransferase 1b, chloroplastic-like isoform X2 [Macadamia integrifolia]